MDPREPLVETAATATPAGRYTLFSTNQITAASFVASPIAGGILLAVNRRRLEGRKEAAMALAIGFGITALLVAVGDLMPARAGGFLPLVGVFAMRGLAQRDKPRFDAHVAAGGAKASGWRAAGIALGSLVLLFALVAPFALKLGPFARPSVDFGHDQHVIYEDGATAADARLVGDFLKTEGFFGDSAAKDVRVRRDHAAYVVGFVVRDGAWNEPGPVDIFRRMRNRIAAGPFARSTLSVELLDDDFESKKKIDGPALASLVFEPEQVLTYETDVTEPEAKRLGDYLVESEFFGPKGNPADVGVRKEGPVFVVSFVVGEGRWDVPEVAKGFEEYRGEIAERVLPGAKVKVELCDATSTAHRTLGP